MVLMKTYSLNAYVRFSIILMELNALKALCHFKLLCMTNAGTDLAVQIPDVSLDLKILLAIQNR